MTARHAVLIVAALAVLGLGVYLFIAVRAEPATVMAPPVRSVADAPPARPPAPTVAPITVPVTGKVLGRRPPAGDTAEPTLAGSAAPAGLGPDAQKLDAIMSEANKAYDRGDYEEARVIAARVLAAEPANVRMLRIVVSSACIEGDSLDAQKHYLQLPAFDRAAMRTRCDRYGVSFTE